MISDMKNYYEILEVNPKASEEVIEKAYRVLVKKYHPDAYVGEKRIYAEEQIRNINEAYRILSDEFLREQYDREIEKEARLYQTNLNWQAFPNHQTKENRKNMNYNRQEEEETERKVHKVGSFMAMVDLFKEIFKNRPKEKGSRKLKKEDKIAAGLTIVIVLVLGIVLWFIPATRGFIRSLIPF